MLGEGAPEGGVGAAGVGAVDEVASGSGAAGYRRLVLARHGQTTWNAEGRFQGQADPPLDATGQAQAERLAAEVLALRPDVLVSSDLVRACQTAAMVSRACGLEVALDRGLREIDLGLWEGLHRRQAEERFPEEYRQWSQGEDVRRGGGETEGEAGARAAASISRIIAATPDGSTAVVVAHGLVLRRAMGLLAEEGTIGLAGGAPGDMGLAGGGLAGDGLADVAPHLDNGRWIALQVAVGRRRMRLGGCP